MSEDPERFVDSGKLLFSFSDVPIREEMHSRPMASFVEFYKQMFPFEKDLDFKVHLKVGELAPL